MHSFFVVAALFASRELRLGPMRLTTYGACAAVGVILAMFLTGRAARRAGVAPEVAWDTGLFAVASCFVASRLLLVASDLRAFTRFPLLVLSLPSLTIGGIALAALAVLVHLRRKQLPVLRLMDAFAPGGAVLAAFLEAGHWSDDSELGMPTLQGGHAVGFRPVSAWGIGAAVILAGVLWAALRHNRVPGRVGALGMMLGGAAAFGLDLVSLPYDLFGTLPLEPGQIVALGVMLSGAVLWTFAPSRLATELEAVDVESAPKVHKEAR